MQCETSFLSPTEGSWNGLICIDLMPCWLLRADGLAKVGTKYHCFSQGCSSSGLPLLKSLSQCRPDEPQESPFLLFFRQLLSVLERIGLALNFYFFLSLTYIVRQTFNDQLLQISYYSFYQQMCPSTTHYHRRHYLLMQESQLLQNIPRHLPYHFS